MKSTNKGRCYWCKSETGHPNYRQIKSIVINRYESRVRVVGVVAAPKSIRWRRRRKLAFNLSLFFSSQSNRVYSTVIQFNSAEFEAVD